MAFCLLAFDWQEIIFFDEMAHLIDIRIVITSIVGRIGTQHVFIPVSKELHLHRLQLVVGLVAGHLLKVKGV